jgi:hypothetical protein
MLAQASAVAREAAEVGVISPNESRSCAVVLEVVALGVPAER